MDKSQHGKKRICSVLSTQTTTETPASRSFTTDVPKSPPKWPLRPGVLVHVKCDTKQNLCANRAQSPTHNASLNASSINNVSYASPLLNSRNTSMASGNDSTKIPSSTSSSIRPELPVRNPKTQIDSIATTTTTTTESKSVARPLHQDVDAASNKESSFLNTDAKKSTANSTETNQKDCKRSGNDLTVTGLLVTNNETNNDELLRFTSSNLIERILGRLRWRREQTTTNSTMAQNSNKKTKGLLRSSRWFGSGKSTNSTTGLMNDTNKHHLNGISSGK